LSGLNNFDANRLVRKPRRVTYNLTMQFHRTRYWLTDTLAARTVMGKYVEVYDDPNGRVEMRAHDAALACTLYDRLSEVNQRAIVENKRLGHV